MKKYQILMEKNTYVINKLIESKLVKKIIKKDLSLILETVEPKKCQEIINSLGLNYKLVFANPLNYNDRFTL